MASFGKDSQFRDVQFKTMVFEEDKFMYMVKDYVDFEGDFVVRKRIIKDDKFKIASGKGAKEFYTNSLEFFDLASD